MSILAENGEAAFVRLRLSTDEIRPLLERHQANYPNADQVEAVARAAVAAGFDIASCRQLLTSAMTWGRGRRNLTRVLANPPNDIRGAVVEANKLLTENSPAEAVERLRRLHRLGQSFASKVARFLSPDKAVILDSVIRKALGYAEDANGYRAFISDCWEAHSILKHGNPGLRICDVEAAIFAKLQGY
jgi:hypothetical protein